LFTTWKEEIQDARDLLISPHYLDSKKDHKKLKEALWRRSFPLALSATVMIFIFLPEIIRIINQSIDIMSEEGFADSLKYYDVKSATFIFVSFLFIALAFYLWTLTLELYKRHKKFEEKRLLEKHQEN
jgi:Na+-driven multidrug efflux pump